jgi:hypothetical protein
MIPTPGPMMMSPVVCAPTIAATYASQFATYHGPNAQSHSIGGVVDGPWAYIGWGIGESGGQSILHYVDHRWCRVESGGGAMDEAMLKSVAGPYYGPRLWRKMWKK